jgi:alkanesulfonate monooxygenase SsuD/methylene tetrahydromethanopterin reductase-like flavin-dependent oxidoreductase (luciferase family)/hemerythrin-like domain-containing protein
VSDYGHALQFGAFITPSAGDAGAVVDLAVLAEASGLDLVTFQDHPYQARFLDAWTLLSVVAARTSRVHVAPNVLNLPLRPPAVVARAAASLDILSGGRVELGLGAGAFWEGIEAMGGPHRTPGQSVGALEEAIDVIRALWDVEQPGAARVEGTYYRLAGAARGPAPRHDIGVWIGAYKPRMLALTGRKADGWLPSQTYLQPGDLAAGNAAIDEAAAGAGRDPRAIRRLLNLSGTFSASRRGWLDGPPGQWIDELTELALSDGVGTFILAGDDPAAIEIFAAEVAPAVRELVAAERAHGGAGGAGPPEPPAAPSPPVSAPARATPPASAPEDEYERLGVQPTLDDGTRLSATEPWDESTRPRRAPSGVEQTYTDRGQLVGKHLIDVHDMLRRELGELRDVLAQVREGALSAGAARSALNEMALRQNDWTLGAFCARYCGVVAQHHGLEDDAIFPHLVRSDAALQPVIERLADEHLVIHDAIQGVDRSLVQHMNHPDDFEPIQDAIDFLTDALLSHLSYEEYEIVEPLARLGFYPGQV